MSILTVFCYEVMLRFPNSPPWVVVLQLHGGQGGHSLEVQGLVVRYDQPSIEFQFIELIDQDGAQHLQHLVLYNRAHADQVEEEFKSHLGLRAKS